MQIRKYRSGDEIDITTIHNSAHSDLISSLPAIYQYRLVSPEEIMDWAKPESSIVWIVESQGQVVGYAQIRVEIERGKQEIPVLQFIPARSWDMNQSNLAVHPSYQQRGVGTCLIESILKEYHSTAEFATALTFNDNVAGEALFQNLGFTMHDAFYYEPFSDEYPLTNSSVYASLNLESLGPPNRLNKETMFRRALVHDAPAVAEIHQNNVWWCDDCGTLDWSMRFIKGEFGHTVFVAEFNGEVVGEIDYLKDGRIGIGGVLPDFRNQGIGSAMFYNLLKVMQKVGFKIAFADSGLTQTEAIKMYERFGFSIERRQNTWVKELT